MIRIGSGVLKGHLVGNALEMPCVGVEGSASTGVVRGIIPFG